MEKDVYVKIGERLRKQRRIMGLTQEQAAELLGVSTTYYGEIERGNRKLTIPRILTVYEKMNLEPTYLLTGEILTDKVYDEIFDGCPREKEQALENLLKENVEKVVREIRLITLKNCIQTVIGLYTDMSVIWLKKIWRQQRM